MYWVLASLAGCTHIGSRLRVGLTSIVTVGGLETVGLDRSDEGCLQPPKAASYLAVTEPVKF